jgi:hypothetical protein
MGAVEIHRAEYLEPTRQEKIANRFVILHRYEDNVKSPRLKLVDKSSVKQIIMAELLVIELP